MKQFKITLYISKSELRVLKKAMNLFAITNTLMGYPEDGEICEMLSNDIENSVEIMRK